MKTILLTSLLWMTLTGTNFAADKQAACDRCHTLTAWQAASFNHTKTDFPLKGAHGIVPCRQCHAGGEFSKKTDHSCRACHKDIHAGQLGQICEKCHDEVSWRSSFGIEAHRRTNFPLVGRHALIPCQECHQDVRERTFTRVAIDCYTCHKADYDATASKSVDHAAFGFGTHCEQCHNPLKWKPAVFAAHNSCFPISSGPHSVFRCTDCHSSVVGLTATGACSTGNTTCTGCHTGAHSQSRTDARHGNVPGYQYKDPKCLQCHHTS